MSESTDKATLLKQTIDWLVETRLLATIEERRAILISARFDDQLMGQIELEGSAAVFSSRLINLLLNYDPLATGKRWLTSLLKIVGASLGIDHQATMAGLIASVNAYVPSPDLVAVGDNQDHITPDERPSLWIGVPDLPRYGLLGRDELVTCLVNQLSTGTAVSISAEGKGGVGKTALAVALAHRRDLLAHFRDGVLWAGLGPDGDPLSALARWGTAVGLDPTDYADPYDLKQDIKGKIGHRVILLIIDDIWQEEHADLLHCGGPNCAHLLTTRDRGIARKFAGSAEESFNVPELADDPAFELLKRIAPEACAADPAAARQLALTVGGLPLAVELAGGYLNDGGPVDANIFPDLSTERLAEIGGDPALRLQQAQARIGAAPGRKATLQTVFTLSLDALPDEQTRAAFYALGAFAPKPATFDRAAAESVAQSNGQTLALLVNRNLLEISAGRLALHQVLADVARVNMDAADQARHRAYYLDLANEDRQDWRTIDAAFSQIRWAWEHLSDEDVLSWVWALRQHQKTRGLWSEHLAWFKRALPIVQAAGQRKDEAVLLNDIGLIYDALGRREEALEHYELALPIMREVGDRGGEATTLNNMGMVYDATGRPAEALRLYEEALPIMREVGDRGGEATTLNNMAGVYDATGRPAEALRLYEEALPIMREVGDRGGEATTLNNMAGVYDATGRPAEALRLYEEALPIRREVGDRGGEATTLNNMGMVYRATGRPEALRLYEEALPIMREVGDRGGEATTLNNMGMVYRATGRPAEALRLYEEALPIMREVGDRGGEAMTLNNMGMVYKGTGRPAEALRLYEQALPIMREVGDRGGEATTLWNVAMLLQQLERTPDAVERVKEAIALFRGGLTHSAGGSTVEQYETFLAKLQAG